MNQTQPKSSIPFISQHFKFLISILYAYIFNAQLVLTRDSDRFKVQHQ